MSKFWTVVTILLIIGSGLLAAEWLESPDINFSDLETECRYNNGNSAEIGADGKAVTFSGSFPTPSTEAELDYSYGISGSNIELDIITRNSAVPDSFYDSCLASVVYEAETDRLEPGNYTVNIYHNGVREERVGIRIR